MKTDPIEVYEHLFSKGNPDAPLVSLGPTAAISTEVSNCFDLTLFDVDMLLQVFEMFLLLLLFLSKMIAKSSVCE